MCSLLYVCFDSLFYLRWIIFRLIPVHRCKQVVITWLCRLRSNGEQACELDRLKSSMESVSTDVHKLDQQRRNLLDQLDSVEAERERLTSVNSELQRRLDLLHEERDGVQQDLEGQLKDAERWSVASSEVFFFCFLSK